MNCSDFDCFNCPQNTFYSKGSCQFGDFISSKLSKSLFEKDLIVEELKGMCLLSTLLCESGFVGPFKFDGLLLWVNLFESSESINRNFLCTTV